MRKRIRLPHPDSREAKGALARYQKKRAERRAAELKESAARSAAGAASFVAYCKAADAAWRAAEEPSDV